MTRFLACCGLGLLLWGAPGAAQAADDTCTRSRLLFVLDKSSSMLNPVGAETKWDVAADALEQVARQYEGSVELGLNVFPEAGACSPGSISVPPALGTADAISSALIEPPPESGNYTPMAQTLDAVAAEPSMQEPGVQPYVVLITDGWQWCYPYDPDTRFAPVDSVTALADAGVPTYVVGFGDGVDATTLNMMAVVGGTERLGCDPAGDTPDSPNPCYYQADSPAQLLAALMDVANDIGGEELCNGIDDDCNGVIDDGTDEQMCGPGAVCESGMCVDEPEDDPGKDDDSDDGPVTDDEGDDYEYGLSGGGCAAAGGTGGGAAGLLGLALLFGRLRRRRRLRLGALAVATTACLGLAGPAQAQSDFSIERFRPATDGNGFLDVEWAGVPQHLDFDLALWFGAADDPLIAYEDRDGGRERIGSVVDHRIGAHLVGALALWDRVQLGVDLPLVIDQAQGDSFAMEETAQYAIGDLRLAPKLRLVGNREAAVSLIAGVTLPTAQGGSYLGESKPVFAPELAFSRAAGGLRLGANVGVRIRDTIENANLTVDDEIFGRVGAAYRFGDPERSPLELASSIAFATRANEPLAQGNSNYVELLGGATVPVSQTVALFAGGGMGIQEGFGAPDWRMLGGLRFGRRSPREAEPLPPLVVVVEEPAPEPEPPKAILHEDRIEILEKVHFETDRAVIHTSSYPLLDSVADILLDHPEVLLVRIEGHTDSRATHTYNQDLSQRRAAAVADYLAGEGIDPVRLEPVGYSETRPIATNDTAEGRAANRRVEFNILERADGASEDAVAERP